MQDCKKKNAAIIVLEDAGYVVNESDVYDGSLTGADVLLAYFDDEQGTVEELRTALAEIDCGVTVCKISPSQSIAVIQIGLGGKS